MQLAIGVLLGQDAAQGEVGRVRLHCDGQVRLEVLQYWRRYDGPLKLPERRICCWRPEEADTFASERGEGGGEGAVVENEFSIEVGEP